MKPGRHLTRPLHRDVAWQKRIGAAHPRRQFALEQRVEMRHLHQRMHTGVSAAGTQGADRQIGKFRQCFFKLVLDGLAGELALPALVGTAAVTQAERQPDWSG